MAFQFPSRLSRRAFPGLVAGLLTIVSCGGDNNPMSTQDGTALAGNWVATTFSVDGTDLVAQGTSLTLTLTLDSTARLAVGTGTWSLVVLNDVNGVLCDGLKSCNPSGVLSVDSDTEMTFDPATADSVTFTYTLSNGNNTLGVDAMLGGQVLTASFNRSSAPVITACAADPADVIVGGLVTLSVSATDPNGAPLTYSWATCVGSKSGLNPPPFLATTAGSCAVTVTVSNGTGSSTCSPTLAVWDPPTAGLLGTDVGTTGSTRVNDPEPLYSNGQLVRNVLVGLSIDAGTVINSVQPIYRILNDDWTLGNETSGAVLGGTGGSGPVELKAPDGYVIVSIETAIQNELDGMRIWYAQWKGQAGADTNWQPSATWVGNPNAGVKYQSPCVNGQFVAGVSVTYNAPSPDYVLETIAVQCASIPAAP